MKSGFQKRKDRDSRQRAAIAAKSSKKISLKRLLAKIKKVVVLLLLVKKLEQLKRLNKMFMKLRLRIAQYQITLLHTQRILPYLLRHPQTAC